MSERFIPKEPEETWEDVAGATETLLETATIISRELRMQNESLTAQVAELTQRVENANEIAGMLREQLVAREADAEVTRVLESLGDDYKVSNDGLSCGWEVIRFYGSFQHQHYESESLRDALVAAGLLKGEGG
jgi:hypothetical protein